MGPATNVSLGITEILDKVDGVKQFVQVEGLGEHGASDLPDEVADLGIARVAGDEDKAPAEMWHCLLYRKVEPVAGEPGHFHVANDDVEFLPQDGADALRTVGDSFDCVAIAFEESLDEALEAFAILKEQDTLRLDDGSRILDVEAVRCGLHC